MDGTFQFDSKRRNGFHLIHTFFSKISFSNTICVVLFEFEEFDFSDYLSLLVFLTKAPFAEEPRGEREHHTVAQKFRKIDLPARRFSFWHSSARSTSFCRAASPLAGQRGDGLPPEKSVWLPTYGSQTLCYFTRGVGASFSKAALPHCPLYRGSTGIQSSHRKGGPPLNSALPP